MAGNPNYLTTLLTTTLEIFLDKTPKDAIFNSIPLLDQLQKRGKKMNEGGTTWLVPIMYDDNDTGGSYSGWDTLNISPQEGFTNMQVGPRYYHWALAIDGQSLSENDGPARMVNILSTKWMQLEKSARNDINTALYGDGTGNNSKDLQGLALLVDAAGTYGNIARASNSWWSAVETAVGGSLQITGQYGLRRLYNDVSSGQGSETPDMYLTTSVIHEAYEALMDPYMRYTNRGTMDVGYDSTALIFKGKPMYWDDACTSGVLYALNLDYLSLYVRSGRDFNHTEFQKPINQDGQVAHVFWAGNLVCQNCRHQGKQTGITNS